MESVGSILNFDFGCSNPLPKSIEARRSETWRLPFTRQEMGVCDVCRWVIPLLFFNLLVGGRKVERGVNIWIFKYYSYDVSWCDAITDYWCMLRPSLLYYFVIVYYLNKKYIYNIFFSSFTIINLTIIEGKNKKDFSHFQFYMTHCLCFCYSNSNYIILSGKDFYVS